MALHESLTDNQLLHSLKNGDAEAFTEIYERYWDKLLVYVMRALRHQGEAEDIVQELFVSVWRRRYEIEISVALSTYLFNSARYLAMRHLSRNLTQYGDLQQLADRSQPTGENDSTGIEAEIYGKELEARIDGLVDSLPDRMKEIFLLSRRQHLSYREIAQRLSISEETVRKQIHKSLQLLRNKLGPLPASLILCITTYYL